LFNIIKIVVVDAVGSELVALGVGFILLSVDLVDVFADKFAEDKDECLNVCKYLVLFVFFELL